MKSHLPTNIHKKVVEKMERQLDEAKELANKREAHWAERPNVHDPDFRLKYAKWVESYPEDADSE